MVANELSPTRACLEAPQLEAADITSSNGLAAATITCLIRWFIMAAAQRPRVFLDVNIGDEPAGRLTIELFVDQTPKTCEK